MASIKGYKTKQKDLILNYFKESNKRHITAEELVDHLKEKGNTVGKSTVYRTLDRLVEQGIIRRFFIEEGYGACYQYSGESNKCEEHFHLKCVSCGELLHIQCKLLMEVEKHILKDHDFSVDNRKTVLYGRCHKCIDTEVKEINYSI